MAEQELPKLLTGVRFSSPAPTNYGAVCAGRRGVAISGRKAWTRDRGFFRLVSPSALKNQARGRAVREQASIDIRDPPFGGANPASTAQHSSFCLDGAGLRRDRPHE